MGASNPERLPPYARSPQVTVVSLLALCRIISQSSINRAFPVRPVFHPFYSPRFIVGNSVVVATRITSARKADEHDVWNVFIYVLLVSCADGIIVV